MQTLALSSHTGKPVTVNHCPPCRLVWFDPLESVHLDGFGWVQLLRAMELGAQRPLADPNVAQPACPLCAAPLMRASNQTRFGRFAALECPQRHGHLHSHSGLLAERGLVRPLGVAERRALASEKHALHCLNCGAPAAAGGDDTCRYCKAALVVIDMPRLAHSLRLRLDDLGPSPRIIGHHAAWACRGCGANLDPGRQTTCITCGHIVVAQNLPDIHPLLDAAEADLKAAANAEAQRVARYPSTQGARPREVRRPGQPFEPGASGSLTRLFMLRGWLPLVLLLLLGCGLIALVVNDVPWPKRPALQHLREQRVGTGPAAGWVWLRAFQQIAPSDTEGHQALRMALFHDAMQQDRRRKPGLTVGTLLDRASEQPRSAIHPVDRGAMAAWNLHLVRHLQPVPGGIPASEPAMQDLPKGGDPQRLQRAAPGFWVDSSSRHFALWMPTVENTGTVALTPTKLTLQLRSDDLGGERWECTTAHGASDVLHAGERLTLACRTYLHTNNVPRMVGAVQRMHAGETLDLMWHDGLVPTPRGFVIATNHMTDEAAKHSLRLDHFLRRHTTLLNGTPPPVVSTANDDRAAEPKWTLAERWAAKTRAHQLIALAGGVLAAFVFYCGVASLFGRRAANIATLSVAAVPSYLFGRGEGAGSILLIGMTFAPAAALVYFGFGFGWHVFRDTVLARFGAPPNPEPPVLPRVRG